LQLEDILGRRVIRIGPRGTQHALALGSERIEELEERSARDLAQLVPQADDVGRDGLAVRGAGFREQPAALELQLLQRGRRLRFRGPGKQATEQAGCPPWASF
jgi:hypothetical protein